ncbi:hypothetical protein ACMFMG_004130 [Clarireedia jacksonii]
MGNCCSSRSKEQQRRYHANTRNYPPPNRPQENIFLTQNPILDQLEAKYDLERRRREAKSKRSRNYRKPKYSAGKYGGTSSRRPPGPVRYADSRSRSKSSTKKPRSAKRHPKKRRNRDDSSDDEESDSETSDSDSDDESDSDSDSDEEVETRSKSRSGKRRPIKKGRKPKKRTKATDDDSDEDEEDSDGDDEEEEEDSDDEDEIAKKKRRAAVEKKKKTLKKGKNLESGKEETRSTKNKKSKSKKNAEDDEVGLLEKEDSGDNEGDVYSDSEYGDSDTTAVATNKDSKDSKDKSKGKEKEVKEGEDGKPNPYRFVNRSSAFLRDQPRKGSTSSSIRARARATPSERASIRQQDIDQRRRQRQGRDAVTKKSKPFGLEDDDEWSDTDASSVAPSSRSGRSSRLSSLFGPRNRSLTPDPNSHKMTNISPLPRSAVGSPRSQSIRSPPNPFTGSPLNPFTASPLSRSARSPLAPSIISPKQSVASVTRVSPLQDITSDDALPANPEPTEAVITPPPPVHQPPEPGLVPVMIIERGKREIQWKPADGKTKKPGDIEMIFGGSAA